MRILRAPKFNEYYSLQLRLIEGKDILERISTGIIIDEKCDGVNTYATIKTIME